MSSKTSVHTEENRFKNIPEGTLVKFANGSDIYVVTNKQQMVYGGVLEETILYCWQGTFTRKVGHMDKEAPGLEIVDISGQVLAKLTNHSV